MDALKNDKAKNVNPLVKKRVLRTSWQLQKLVNIGGIENQSESWVTDGGPVGVLIAWACPELVATRQETLTRKQQAAAKWGTKFYRTFSGNEGRLKKDALTDYEQIAIAVAQDTKIFWAAPLDKSILENYKISTVEMPMIS